MYVSHNHATGFMDQSDVSDTRIFESALLDHGVANGAQSLRSSLDESSYIRHSCDVTVWDDTADEQRASHPSLDAGYEASAEFTFRSTIVGGGPKSPCTPDAEQQEWSRLRNTLGGRDELRTRWVNIVGWSPSVLRIIEMEYLGQRPCFNSQDGDRQAFGGPIDVGDEMEYLWLQTPIWMLGEREKEWSSLKQVDMRMFLRLPTQQRAGILITNFTGPQHLAREASQLLTSRLLHSHSLHRKTLRCVWILTFAILRSMTEQMEFTFDVFDLVDASGKVRLASTVYRRILTLLQASMLPQMKDLPTLLANSQRLRMMDRYLAGIEEVTTFFSSARQALACAHDESLAYCNTRTTAYAQLEVGKAVDKVLYGQRLCRSYIEHTGNLMQIVCCIRYKDPSRATSPVTDLT